MLGNKERLTYWRQTEWFGTASRVKKEKASLKACSPLKRYGGWATGWLNRFQADRNSVLEQRAAHTHRLEEGSRRTKADSTVKPLFLQQHRDCVEKNL